MYFSIRNYSKAGEPQCWWIILNSIVLYNTLKEVTVCISKFHKDKIVHHQHNYTHFAVYQVPMHSNEGDSVQF